MALQASRLAFIVFPSLALYHLYKSPYTKVEESFNIQAIHDFLEYGVPFRNATAKIQTFFDHSTFPGAVPRTFIGSLLVSGLAGPVVSTFDLAGKAAQTYVRALLGMLNAVALAIFARSVDQAYGSIAATWYVALQASQFHVWYYATRTLPNMFAFCLSTLGLACLLPKTTAALSRARNVRLGLYLLTIATIIFRAELALLLTAHCVWLLLKPHTFDLKVTLVRKTLIPAILPGAILALFLTVTIDSRMWCSAGPLWPEMAGFLSNVFPTDGKGGASAWGTQPIHWYFSAAIPRLLMGHAPLTAMSVLFSTTRQDIRVLDSLVPSLFYLALYSLLPHKETRFVFPVLPSLTLVAALVSTRLTINVNKSMVTKITFYGVVVTTLSMTLLNHTALLPLSAQNYPGGQALYDLHNWYADNSRDVDTRGEHIHVHLTNLALQTGVTRFLEQPLPVNSSGHALFRPVFLEATYDHEARKPLVLPGDANHPALTIQPSPQSTAAVKSTIQQPQRWVYDKTSDETRFLEPTFWDQFDFVVVENPHQVIGAWSIVATVKAVGKPRVLRPQAVCEWRFQSNLDHGDMDESDTTALLYAMYPSSIARRLSQTFDLLHDVVRCGRWLPFRIGWWLEVPLQMKLYILQKSSSSTLPNHELEEAAATQQEIVHGLPESASTDQEPLEIDRLGPLVVNKDGTLSRLENWSQMNGQERKKTVEYLKKRNMIRLEAAPS